MWPVAGVDPRLSGGTEGECVNTIDCSRRCNAMTDDLLFRVFLRTSSHARPSFTSMHSERCPAPTRRGINLPNANETKLSPISFSSLSFPLTIYGHLTNRHHLSYDDCLEVKKENNQNCSVLCSERHLCTMIRTHM